MPKVILFFIAVVVVVIVAVFGTGWLAGDFSFSETLLSIHSSSLLSFLKKSKKKKEKGKEVIFEQISFLKKKMKKEEWRKLFEVCLQECRGIPSDKFLVEKYAPPYIFFVEKKEERKEFEEFWKISSTSSSLNEKEKEWVKEVEENVERKAESEFLKI